jgi:hypothetical protein
MTRDEALKQAENCLEFVVRARYSGYPETDKAVGLLAQAKAEAAKAYIDLARELDKPSGTR